MYWWIILVIGFFVGLFFDLFVAFVSRSFSFRKEPFHFRVKNIKVHHSCVGLVCFLFSLFFYTMFFLGAGVGIIVSHGFREKSVLFIETRSRKYF